VNSSHGPGDAFPASPAWQRLCEAVRTPFRLSDRSGAADAPGQRL